MKENEYTGFFRVPSTLNILEVEPMAKLNDRGIEEKMLEKLAQHRGQLKQGALFRHFPSTEASFADLLQIKRSLVDDGQIQSSGEGDGATITLIQR